ncbi:MULTISPECIES: hypothetical protein [unclassified Streptomyces]
MTKYSSSPADEIPTALEAFDRFFPLPNGWLAAPTSGGSVSDRAERH